MRFRKYSRKHAFNILYQWDITGEDIEKLSKEYWENLERSYRLAASVAENLKEQIEGQKDFSAEVYSKKFEALADEEILADKLREKLFAVYLLLKAVEDFHNFALTYTGWISEKAKPKLKKALSILSEIEESLEKLQRVEGIDKEALQSLTAFIKAIKENPPQDFESLKGAEEEFRQKVLKIVAPLLEEIKRFSTKRVEEDMGEIKEYAEKLLDAYKGHKIEVDSTIEEFLKDWTLDSLGSIERNLLRLGTAEFLYVGVQDPGRAFNDYIDFAKAFVGKRAAKFVNGVLSAIYNKKVAPSQGEN
jgi:N utilization substance protein B